MNRDKEYDQKKENLSRPHSKKSQNPITKTNDRKENRRKTWSRMMKMFMAEEHKDTGQD